MDGYNFPGSAPQVRGEDPFANPFQRDEPPDDPVETPDITVEKIDYTPPASLKELHVANQIMLMALANSKIIRLNLQDPTNETYEISVWDDVSVRIHNAFLSPCGNHILVSLTNGDLQYLHISQMRPHTFKEFGKDRIRNNPHLQFIIESLAWDEQAGASQSVNTYRIVFGTTQGGLYEVQMSNEYQNDNNYFIRNFIPQKIWQFGEGKPITGVCWGRFPGDPNNYNRKNYCAVYTESKLIQFVGGPSFKEMIQQTTSPFAIDAPGAESHFKFWKKKTNNPQQAMLGGFVPGADYFGWVTGQGLFHGPVQLNENTSQFLQRPTLMQGFGQPPKAVLLTENHFLLLCGDAVKAVSRISSQTSPDFVWEHKISGYPFLGYSVDPKTEAIWLYSRNKIFELRIKNETSYLWKKLLDLGKYELAIQYARPEKKNQILQQQVDALWKVKDYVGAAVAMAKNPKSFAEDVLKFVEINQINALTVYLQTRLSALRYEDASQKTLLVIWLVEIYLRQLDQLEFKSTPEAQMESQKVLEKLKKLLVENKADLTRDASRATIHLLESYGQTGLVILVAHLMNDFEQLLLCFLDQRNWEKALLVLESVDVATMMKHIPVLIYNAPEETVQTLMKPAIYTKFKPADLIPALMRCGKTRSVVHPVVRFLEFIISKGCTAPEIHNYLITFYAKMPDEAKFIHFIRHRADNNLPIFFELDFALQLCQRFNRRQSEVYVYSLMELHSEAVAKALKINIQFAKDMADRPKDEEVKKQQWYTIIKHLVEVKKDIKGAMACLGQCHLMTIEDIIRFLPDNSKIQDFSEEICACLEESNRRVFELKQEMKKSTMASELIQKDIHKLQKRVGRIEENQLCDLTKLPVAGKQFYLFPDGSCYLLNALVDQLLPILEPLVAERVNVLHKQIVALGNTPQNAVQVSRIREKLDAIIAVEHPNYSNYLIQSISQPFTTEEDELASWKL